MAHARLSHAPRAAGLGNLRSNGAWEVSTVNGVVCVDRYSRGAGARASVTPSISIETLCLPGIKPSPNL
jgi:hypothetical protein